MLSYQKIIKTRRESNAIISYISDIILEVPDKFQVKFSTSEHLTTSIKSILERISRGVTIKDSITIKTSDTEFTINLNEDIVTFRVSWNSFRSEVKGNYMSYTMNMHQCKDSFIQMLSDMNSYKF